MQEQKEVEVVIRPETAQELPRPVVPAQPVETPLQSQTYAAPEQQQAPPRPYAQQSVPQPASFQPSPQPSPPGYAEPQQSADNLSTLPDLQQPKTDLDDTIILTWQSSEFEDRSKSGVYYLAIAGVAVALTGFVFWVTEQDILPSVAVFLAVIGFAYLASHKPAQLDYALGQHNLYIGNKARSYDEFKNFSANEDGSATNIMLVPHKRFGSPLILRLDNEQKDDVVNTLSQFLPVEQRKLDAIDHLMRRMRL